MTQYSVREFRSKLSEALKHLPCEIVDGGTKQVLARIVFPTETQPTDQNSQIELLKGLVKELEAENCKLKAEVVTRTFKEEVEEDLGDFMGPCEICRQPGKVREIKYFSDMGVHSKKTQVLCEAHFRRYLREPK